MWAVDFVSCVALSVALGGESEPVWGYLVGPAGEGKTELLMGLEGWESRTFFVSDLTPNAMMSANPIVGEEASLLPKLDGRVLVFKDFTTLLTKAEQERKAILGQLREIFDGQYARQTGLGRLSWRGRIGFLAGVTPAIETILRDNQVLGERSLMFRMGIHIAPRVERMAHLKHVLSCAGRKKELKASIKDFMGAAIEGGYQAIRQMEGIRPTRTEEMECRLIQLAALMVDLRSQTLADGTAVRTESANRVVQQLMNLGDTRCKLDGRTEWTKGDFTLVRRVAEDTLPLVRRWAVQALIQRGVGKWVKKIAWTNATQSEEKYAKRCLAQWKMLGIVECRDEGRNTELRLSDEVSQDFIDTGFLGAVA